MTRKNQCNSYHLLNLFCNCIAHHSDSQLFALLSRFRSHCILFVRCATAFCNAAHSTRHIVSLFHCIPIVQICSFYITALFFTSYITFYTIIDTALFHYFIAYSLYKQIYPFYITALFYTFYLIFQLYKSLPKPSLY